MLAVLLGAALILSGCSKPPPPQKPARTLSQNPWVLETDGTRGHKDAYLANGYLGMRVGVEGSAWQDGKPLLTLISGLYNAEHIVQAPVWGALELHNGVRWLRASDGYLSGFRQRLDLRRGVLTTSYRWEADRRPVDVEITLFVAREVPDGALPRDVCVLRARLTPRYNGSLAVSCPRGLAGPQGYLPARTEMRGRWNRHVVADGKHAVLVITGLRADPGFSPGGAVPKRESPLPAQTGQWSVRDGEPVELERWDAVSVSSAIGGPATLETGDLDGLMGLGYEAVLRAHEAAWARLWTSDIQIEGSPRDQQVARAFLFYLYSSVREGLSNSIPPLGLSGTFWGGHIFWDADRWMFPVLVLLRPELARSIVEYRQVTLPGAIYNASQRGLPGADFATESAETGREIAPAEFPFEDHNSADVAVAQWEHYLVTGASTNDLELRYWPVLKATADFWVGRSTWNAKAKRYEIRRVISPDETASFVDNDVYTNAMARRNLRFAMLAARQLGRPVPAAWKRVADGLWLPFDPKVHRYLEHEGFNPGRRKLKQADAQLLAFPMRLPMPDAVKAQFLDYYAPITSPRGPAMTQSIHSVIASDLGRREQAYRFFGDSFLPFLRPPFHLFSEKRGTDNTNFLTGQAGTLMAVLYGFAGVHLEGLEEGEARLTVHPRLPAAWKRLVVRGLHFRGKVYDLTVGPGARHTLTERESVPALATRG